MQVHVCVCVAVFSSLTTRSAAGAAEQECENQRVAPSAVSGRVRGRSPPGWCPGRPPPACCRTDALSSSGSPAVGGEGFRGRWRIVSSAGKLSVWVTLRRFTWPTDLVWVAQDDHLCHFSRASGWKRVPAGGPHV